MKKLITTILILSIFCFAKCEKDDVEPTLPPETTTGAMTFGCKINGKVFVPKDGRGKPGLYCQYVNLGNGPGGGWYLNIPATNWAPSTPESVNVGTDSLLLIEGATYNFRNQKGYPSGIYLNSLEYNTVDINSGELKIKKFDIANRIISGTFFFTAKNISSGQIVSISEGRFDIRY